MKIRKNFVKKKHNQNTNTEVKRIRHKDLLDIKILRGIT